MANFAYKPRATEDWDKRGKQTGGQFASYILDEYKTFSPKKNDNYVRILPPTWDDPHHYGMDLWVHYGVGPDNGTVICLWKMLQKQCPICKAYERAEQAGREDARDYKPTRRVLVWIVDRKDESLKEPLLWAMPWTLDRDISKICKDRQTGELYQIDHPESGYDVTFEREGEPPMVKYIGIQLARRPSAVDQKFIDYIIEHPVQETLNWRTFEEVQALFEGAPVQGTPAPVSAPTTSAAPVATVPPISVQAQEEAFCTKKVKVAGVQMICVLDGGHGGECDFVPLESVQPDAPPAAVATPYVPPPPPPPPPAVAQPEVSAAVSGANSRAAALRARFTTGSKQ